MLRVLALSPYPIEGPSARYRVYAFREPLRALGIDLDIRPFMPPSMYADWMRHKRLTPRTLATLGGASLRRVHSSITAGRYDLVWIHRQTAPAFHQVFDRLFTRTRAPLVFDVDDAVFTEYPIDHLLRACRAATVGNRYLARYVQTVAPQTETLVVPTVVDTRRYLPTEPRERERPVVGWIGTGSSFGRYLLPVLPDLARTCREHGADFEVVASPDARAATEAAGGRFVPWSLAGELAALHNFDIGVMPLHDDAYVRGKCAFKLIEYGAVGLPSVGTNIGANPEVVVDGVTGFLADSWDEFGARLVGLIRDPALRERMGRRARERIVARYSLEAQAQALASLFRQIVGA